MIPAFEEAVVGMQPGGIRRVIVPQELGYPEQDWRKLGPKPSTFAVGAGLAWLACLASLCDGSDRVCACLGSRC